MSDKKLDQIRALLAKAESTTHEAERDAFREKAYALIAKYGIDEALLAAEQGTTTGWNVSDLKFEAHAPFAPEKLALWNAVSGPLGIRTVWRQRWASGANYRQGKSDRRMLLVHAFGSSSDLERAELLYTSLLLQQADEFARARDNYVPADEFGQDRTAYLRSFLNGYSTMVWRNFSRMVNTTVNQTTGAELVLVDRDQAVQNRMNEEYPNAKTAKERKLSGEGWAAGAVAGNRARLGGPEVEETNRKAVAR